MLLRNTITGSQQNTGAERCIKCYIILFWQRRRDQYTWIRRGCICNLSWRSRWDYDQWRKIWVTWRGINYYAGKASACSARKRAV